MRLVKASTEVYRLSLHTSANEEREIPESLAAVIENPSVLPEVCDRLDANRIIELVRELTNRGFTVPTALVDDCAKRAPEVEDWLRNLDESNAIRTKTPPDILQATLELTTEPIELPVVLGNHHPPPVDLTTDFAVQAPETRSLFEHIDTEG